MLDIRRLAALHALSTHGTVTAAARAVHVSAPAVSQQLAALERETGVKLIERVGRGVRITPAGQTLVSHTRIILDQIAAAEAAVGMAGAAITGTVRVAAFSTAVGSLIACARQRLAAHSGDVRVDITTREPEEAVRALQAGLVDVAITYSYDGMPRTMPPGLDSQELLRDPVFLLTPAQPANEVVSLAQLAESSWVAPAATADCGRMLERVCGAAGFVPQVTARCTDFATMIRLVEAGAGVALIPSLALEQLPDRVACHPLERPTHRTVSALTRPSAANQPLVHMLLDHLRAVSLERAE